MVRNYYILFFAACFFAGNSFAQTAQRDTARKQQVVEITSEYKPVLRNAVKINFSATNLTADTSRTKLQYNIPSQNLFYTYQPLPVKPLALQVDTALDLGTRNFIKLGFGNYSTPYAKGGFSFGDGKKSLVNIYGDYISSTNSTIKYQDYSQFNGKVTASFFTPKNEIYGAAGISQNTYNLYGYGHVLYPNYTKQDVQQRFSDLNVMVGIRNSKSNESGINYDPSLKVDFFTLQNRLAENSVIVNAPFEKTFDNAFTIKVAAKLDATTYSTNGLPVNVNFQNNVYQLAPAVELSGERYSIHAGIAPTWDNNQASILPDIYAVVPIKDKAFEVQVGWVGQINKNTYQNLTNINPYLLPVSSQLNTKEMEFYGGIKATVGKHFNFNAKASYISFTNLPLFVNDTATDYKGFNISNAGKANDFRVHADMSYIGQDKFTITGGLTINGYTGIQNNSHAWGLVPIQFDASLRWWAYKTLLVKADLNAFGGAPYLLKGNVSNTLSGGSDLNVGVEYVINKKFSAWLDFNNLLNNKYQRWYNYPVYGLNVLVGVIYKF